MNALEILKDFIAAVETGSPRVAELLHPEVEQHELPNRLYAQGMRRDRAALLEGSEKGKKVLRSQRYEISSAVVDGDRVALEAVWTGVLAVPVGTLQPGDQLKAHLAMFAVVEGGQIRSLHNYDCYEPF